MPQFVGGNGGNGVNGEATATALPASDGGNGGNGVNGEATAKPVLVTRTAANRAERNFNLFAFIGYFLGYNLGI